MWSASRITSMSITASSHITFISRKFISMMNVAAASFSSISQEP